MAYRVELTERAVRDLRRIYVTINAPDQQPARDWFDGLEHTVFSLADYPARGAPIPKTAAFATCFTDASGIATGSSMQSTTVARS
jgi:plasmid stabilization system protein ParE